LAFRRYQAELALTAPQIDLCLETTASQSRATDHYTAQASRSNIGIFINQKDD
jgi:hypothetical protein